MGAPVEDELEGADLPDDAWRSRSSLDDVDLRLGDAGGTAQTHRRPAAEDARPRALGDGWSVERVVEVRVSEDDGVRAREVAGEQGVVRAQGGHDAAQE